MKVKFLARAGIIAALYAVLNIINPLAWSSSYAIRIANLLKPLAVFLPEAPLGLAVGGLISSVLACHF